jgi:enamine deaminase RidA (YjgF/YER057c/UK114 family)
VRRRRRRANPELKKARKKSHIRVSTMHVPRMLNAAYHDDDPSCVFSRGMRCEIGETTLWFLSGAASLNHRGKSKHPGDFRAQCLRMYANLTALLVSEGATWHNLVKAVVFLADMLEAVFGFGTQTFADLRDEMWPMIFRRTAGENLPGLITTFVFERTVKQSRPDHVVDLVDAVTPRGGRVLFVELTCDRTEHQRRRQPGEGAASQDRVGGTAGRASGKGRFLHARATRRNAESRYDQPLGAAEAHARDPKDKLPGDYEVECALRAFAEVRKLEMSPAQRLFLDATIRLRDANPRC